MKTKYESVLKKLQSASQRFAEVMAKPKTDIIRDSVIQGFEFAFELTWKTLKAYLEEYNGAKDLHFPKDVFKAAFQAGFIKDDPKWSKMVGTRNMTSHLYKGSIAEKVLA